MSKRIVLWEKQRKFIDELIKGEKPCEAILGEQKITMKMFERWLAKPAFKRRYNQIRRFLDHRRDLNLKISASHGARRLVQEQLKADDPPTSKESLDTVKESRHEPKKPIKPKRPPLRRLSHPDNSDEETARLIKNLKYGRNAP